MMEIKNVALASLSVDGRGSYGIGASAVERSNDLYTYLRITDIRDDGTINMADLKSVDDEKAYQYLLKPNDIVFARTGASTGRNYFYDGRDGEFVYAGFLIKFSIDPQKVNPKYVKYYCMSDDYKNWIHSFNTGSTRGNINAQTLGGMLIPIPPCQQQDGIVDILSSLDEKIRKNTKINDNLAQQSDLIFNNLFGQYYREQTIPSGWTYTELGNMDVLVTDYVANGSFKSLADNVQYLDKETDNVLIRLTDYNNNYNSDMIYLSDESYEFLSKSKLYGDEIIISNVGANVGTVFRCPRLNKRMSLGPNAILLRSEKYEHYLFLLFKSKYGQGLLQSIVTGSAQPKFNKTNFRALKVLVPDENTLNIFNDTYSSIFEKISENTIENKHLSQIRDTLLPKLMSGELDVTDIDF